MRLFPLMLGIVIIGAAVATAAVPGSPLRDSVFAPFFNSGGQASGDVTLNGNNFTATAPGNVYFESDVPVQWGDGGAGVYYQIEHDATATDWCIRSSNKGAGVAGDMICVDDTTNDVQMPQGYAILGAATPTGGICLDGISVASNLFVYGGDCTTIKNIQGQNITANGYLRTTTPSFQFGSVYGVLDAGSTATDGLRRHLMNAGTGVQLDIRVADTLTLTDEAGNALTVKAADFQIPAGYTRHLEFAPSAAILGATAPGTTTVSTFRGLAFDADAEEVFLTHELPPSWNAASDMTLRITWTNEPGIALGAGETVKWDCTYRTVAVGEDIDATAATAITATYTQSGAGTDGELIETDLTVDYDDATNPLASMDTIGFECDRDMSGDTYASDAVVLRWELVYTASTLATQH